MYLTIKEKRKRSDSVLLQKPLHQKKKSKTQHDKTKTPQQTSITQRLRTDLARLVGVMTASQRVWLIRFRGSQNSISKIHILCPSEYELWSKD